MRYWGQWGFQDAVSPIIEEFIDFHDFAIILVLFITIIVFWVILSTSLNQVICFSLIEGQIIEWIWTLIPALVLIQIAVPSLILLYLLDEFFQCHITVKSVGHQWYWSYEYRDEWNNGPAIEFDSYMDLRGNNEIIRLLDVDNRLTLPFELRIRIVVTSMDVLHSWTVPTLGVKADATPGRLNQINLISYRPGVYYGQCSEICGANHSFMPICVEFISMDDYFWWVIK